MRRIVGSVAFVLLELRYRWGRSRQCAGRFLHQQIGVQTLLQRLSRLHGQLHYTQESIAAKLKPESRFHFRGYLGDIAHMRRPTDGRTPDHTEMLSAIADVIKFRVQA